MRAFDPNPIAPAEIAPSEIARAAALLAAGRLVAFPTETVYGLGVDARSDAALELLYAVKGRPPSNPLIAHVTDAAAADRIAPLDARAARLAAAFWPGPLTLVLTARPGAVAARARAGLATVGVRAPAHPIAQALLAAFGGPVAAPSANPSGKLSPTTAEAVRDGLGAALDLVLDGGPCAIGLESSILDLSTDRPRLLRAGGAPLEALEAALGEPIETDAPAGPLRAPGMLASHYAPRARLRLDAAGPAPGEAWLGFGPDPDHAPGPARNLSPAGDLAEAAHGLFEALRALDAEADAIAVAPIPGHGLGRAIRDRLARAAAPR